jgi:hypothetical protein
MMEYDWPGNVRELENFVERALVTHLGTPAIRFDPPSAVRQGRGRQLLERAGQEEWSLARLEREYVLQVVEAVGGRRGEAADRLGIDRRTLHRKLKGYALDLEPDLEPDLQPGRAPRASSPRASSPRASSARESAAGPEPVSPADHPDAAPTIAGRPRSAPAAGRGPRRRWRRERSPS